MTFPRACALAELGWSEGVREWTEFYRRLRSHYDRMGAQGIRFRLMPPRVSYKGGVLTAAVDDDSQLTFTVDGAQPQPYTGPIRTERPELYLFRSSYRSGRSPEVGAPAYYRTLKPAVKITTSMGESKQFPYARAEEYRGIARTARTCRKGDWIRYDFAEPLACRELAVRTGNLQLPRFTFTTGYVESSADGETFERVGRVGERRADDPPAAEADLCDPRRLDLRRQRLPLRDGAVARRQVNEEARRRFGGNPLQDSRRFFAGRPSAPERSAAGSPRLGGA